MYRGVARGLKYTASSNFSFQSKWLSSYSPLSVMPVTLRQRRDEDLSSAPPISSHAEYLVQLGKTSQLVRQSFSHLDWIVRDVGFERSQQAKVYLFHASRDVFIAKQKILRSAGHLINYMSENLSQVCVKYDMCWYMSFFLFALQGHLYLNAVTLLLSLTCYKSVIFCHFGIIKAYNKLRTALRVHHGTYSLHENFPIVNKS